MMKKKAVTKKKPPKSANDWLLEILSESNGMGTPDEVPDGWLTMQEMAKMAGVSKTTMFARVGNLLNKGILQRKKFRILVGRGCLSVWHFNKA